MKSKTFELKCGFQIIKFTVHLTFGDVKYISALNTDGSTFYLSCIPYDTWREINQWIESEVKE